MFVYFTFVSSVKKLIYYKEHFYYFCSKILEKNSISATVNGTVKVYKYFGIYQYVLYILKIQINLMKHLYI